MIYLLYFVTDDFGELPDQEIFCVSSSVSPARCNTVHAFCLNTTRLDSPGEERTAMSSKKSC